MQGAAAPSTPLGGLLPPYPHLATSRAKWNISRSFAAAVDPVPAGPGPPTAGNINRRGPTS